MILIIGGTTAFLICIGLIVRKVIKAVNREARSILQDLGIPPTP